jgi:hypothetical protein
MESNIFLIPVGKSPVHCHRLLCAIVGKNPSKVILVVSDETKDSGIRIKNANQHTIGNIMLSNYMELGSILESISIETKVNIISGPATREINLKIWYEVISRFNNMPSIWVDHGRRTKRGHGKLIGEHYLHNLSNKKEKLPLPNVSISVATKIYEIELENYSSVGKLSWNEKESKFYFRIYCPEDADTHKQDYALSWETNVKHYVANLRTKLGHHVLKVSHDELPSRPRFWMNIRSRMSDFDIFGGSN